MAKVKLNVLGISYSQTTSGAYALVLGEEDGKRRIPIIIGGYEAQAIAIQLEGLKPPRPLTHDLFLCFAKVYKINLIDVQIYKLEEGVFFSKLHFSNNEKEYYIDSRTSDAVALSLRFGCPVYTTKEILEKAGITLEIDEIDGPPTDSSSATETKKPSDDSFTKQLKRLSMTELNELISKSIDEEDYEKASKIRDEIKRREEE